MHQPDDDRHTTDQYADHLATIGAAVTRWRNGQISAYDKRKAIADENLRYYGGHRKSPITGETLTGMPRTGDVMHVLADSAGVSVEAMKTAMRAWHRGNALADEALADGATREAAMLIAADGRAAYRDIVRSAQEGTP